MPGDLRSRWTLHLGSSKDLLPSVLEESGDLDLFYHDSLHTFEHILWECRTAGRFLRDGGILLSDDIFWNRAFWVFAREVGYIKCGTRRIRKKVRMPAPHSLGDSLHAESRDAIEKSVSSI